MKEEEKVSKSHRLGKDSPIRTGIDDSLLNKHSIQVQKDPTKMINHIPCLYLPFDEGSNKMIIYFHGNAEDIGLAFDLLYLVGQKMQMHMLAVEYQG